MTASVHEDLFTNLTLLTSEERQDGSTTPVALRCSTSLPTCDGNAMCSYVKIAMHSPYTGGTRCLVFVSSRPSFPGVCVFSAENSLKAKGPNKH